MVHTVIAPNDYDLRKTLWTLESTTGVKLGPDTLR
jgi:hypothetical protein